VKQNSIDQRIMAIVAGVVIMLVVVVVAVVALHVSLGMRTAKVTINGTTITARVADTPSLQARGLSHTASLRPEQGMLFIFSQSGAQGIWMKDMQYPLDILWLDGDKTVVHIETNVSPQTYPKVFRSPTPANYVLELPAGFVKAHQVVDGSQMLF
jgi:uncharacterized protein